MLHFWLCSFERFGFLTIGFDPECPLCLMHFLFVFFPRAAVHAMLSVAVTNAAGGTFAVLEALNCSEPSSPHDSDSNGFSHDDECLLKGMAHAIAIAARRAQIEEEVRQLQYSTLRALFVIS